MMVKCMKGKYTYYHIFYFVILTFAFLLIFSPITSFGYDSDYLEIDNTIWSGVEQDTVEYGNGIKYFTNGNTAYFYVDLDNVSSAPITELYFVLSGGSSEYSFSVNDSGILDDEDLGSKTANAYSTYYDYSNSGDVVYIVAVDINDKVSNHKFSITSDTDGKVRRLMKNEGIEVDVNTVTTTKSQKQTTTKATSSKSTTSKSSSSKTSTTKFSADVEADEISAEDTTNENDGFDETTSPSEYTPGVRSKSSIIIAIVGAVVTLAGVGIIASAFIQAKKKKPESSDEEQEESLDDFDF